MLEILIILYVFQTVMHDVCDKYLGPNKQHYDIFANKKLEPIVCKINNKSNIDYTLGKSYNYGQTQTFCLNFRLIFHVTLEILCSINIYQKHICFKFDSDNCLIHSTIKFETFYNFFSVCKV